MQALKSTVIKQNTLRTFDDHFHASLKAFPPNFQPESREPLDPRSIGSIVALINTRIILHRHNLSVSCTPDVRATAMELCCQASMDTAHLLSRAAPILDKRVVDNRVPGGGYEWAGGPTVLGQTASTMLASHIWRCTLILLFCAHYDAALICLRTSAAIGSHREINVACGRNLAFFINTLIEKRRAGGPIRDMRDEELLAYVSGDMQANTEHGWVWQGSETGTALQNVVLPGQTEGKEEWIGNMKGSLNENESNGWGGWDRAEYLVGVLRDEDERRDGVAARYGAPEAQSYTSPAPRHQGGSHQAQAQGMGMYPPGPPMHHPQNNHYSVVKNENPRMEPMSHNHDPTRQTHEQQPPTSRSGEKDVRNTRDRISIANII